MKFARFLVLTAVLATPVALADDETPNTFMNHVFAKYSDRAHWPKNYAPCNEFCEAPLAKLVKKLDYDPVCQCRGPGGHYIILAGKFHADGNFEYTLRDANNARKLRQWIVILTPAGASWKITDITERRLDGKTSLRKRLEEGGSGMLL
jgi:hypothetical protein